MSGGSMGGHGAISGGPTKSIKDVFRRGSKSMKKDRKKGGGLGDAVKGWVSKNKRGK